MKKSVFDILRRYAVATFGLFVVALGIALSTRSNLGTSPISCPPYVMSLYGGLTMGQYTILLHCLLISLQIALLRSRFHPVMLLQLIPSLMFGYFTDFTMAFTAVLQSDSYPARMLLLLAGCIVIAAGMVIEVCADAWMLAGDKTVAVIADVSGMAFGRVKVSFDCAMTAIGIILSFCLMGRLDGIREGTVVSALVVGVFIKWLQKPIGTALARSGLIR